MEIRDPEASFEFDFAAVFSDIIRRAPFALSASAARTFNFERGEWGFSILIEVQRRSLNYQSLAGRYAARGYGDTLEEAISDAVVNATFYTFGRLPIEEEVG